MISPSISGAQPPPLSVLVLLPESISAASQRFATAATQAQGSLSAGSSPNLRSAANGRFSPHEDDTEIDPHTTTHHSRRLSLAPGLGSGLRTQGGGSPASSSALSFSPPSPAASAPPSLRPATSTLPSLPNSPEHRSTELKSHHVRSNSVHRSNQHLGLDSLTLSSAALMIPRGSVALPSGSSLMGAANSRRHAIVGDELVDVLRQGGLEVTAVRQATHLPGILASGASSTTISQLSAPRSPTQPAQHVILCPLGETPQLPSLSLLMARGTTPSAVCFQQDLLDRARKVEDEWLTKSLSTIQHVEQLCSTIPEDPAEASGSLASHPIIFAYVTAGTPSPTVVEALISSGAFGVLSPPYTLHTASIVRQLVVAGKSGNTATAIGLSSPPLHNANVPLQSVLEDETKVVLTPTALGLGAEHESEKVLSAFTHQRRRISTQLSLSRVISPGSAASLDSDSQVENREPLQTGTSTSSIGHTLATPSTTVGHFPSLSHLYEPHGAQTSYDASRRRSVDTGGIALAFDRATKRIIPMEKVEVESFDTVPPNAGRRGSINVVAGDKEQEAADGSNTTQFAEVLGEMYEQTMSSIDIQMGEYEELATPISKEERARLVGALSSWDFRPHQLSSGDLYRVACLLFESVLHSEGIADLAIGRDQVNRFLFAVRAIYHAPNPYHNYVHAIDVLQATYLFLNAIGVVPPFEFMLTLEPGKSLWKRHTEESLPPLGHGTRRARVILRPQDVLGIMIAAMGHDVGHPGLSNAFMKNAKVPLSVVYDDKSVLENMHCMLIVHLLRKHGFGFLLGPASSTEAAKFPARAAIDSRGFRRVLYSAILATDMALHFAWIQRLKDFAEAMRSDNPGDRTKLNEEDRVMLCQALIKCADISNPTRPIDISEHWSTVLLDEWTKQASLEEELELPVSVVAGVDARLQAKGQVGFIDLFTNPLFKTTADVIPEMRMYAESCDNNRETWQTRLEILETDTDVNDERTAVLRDLVRPPLVSAQDERFTTLFPLILPAGLVSPETPTRGTTSGTVGLGIRDRALSSATPPQSPMYPRTGGGVPASPAVQAVRVVYRDEVHDRSMLARHVLALTGFDPAMGARRMSTPEVLFVQSRS